MSRTRSHPIRPRWKSTADQAKTAALAKYPGATFNQVEFENRNGTLTCGVELTNATGARAEEFPAMALPRYAPARRRTPLAEYPALIRAKAWLPTIGINDVVRGRGRPFDIIFVVSLAPAV